MIHTYFITSQGLTSPVSHSGGVHKLTQSRNTASLADILSAGSLFSRRDTTFLTDDGALAI